MTKSTLSLKNQDAEATPMNEGLDKLIGKTFEKSRFGNVVRAELIEVGRRDVLLKEKDRVDSFTVSIKELKKFYKQID